MKVLVLSLIFIAFGAISGMEIPPPAKTLPTGWKAPTFTKRVFKPLDVNSKKKYIETYILTALPAESNSYQEVVQQRELEALFLRQKFVKTNDPQRFLAFGDISFKKFKENKPVYRLYRIIAALDSTESDYALLATADAIDDLHRRAGAYFTNFPSKEWLAEKHGDFGSRLLGENSYGAWAMRPIQWYGGFNLYPEVANDPGTESCMTVAPQIGGNFICYAESLVTEWQNSHNAPYNGGPNPVTNVWLWRDYWYDTESADWASHLQYVCERDNAKAQLPLKVFINAAGVTPTAGINWEAKYAEGKPCFINTRPPVPKDTWQPTHTLP